MENDAYNHPPVQMNEWFVQRPSNNSCYNYANQVFLMFISASAALFLADHMIWLEITTLYQTIFFNERSDCGWLDIKPITFISPFCENGINQIFPDSIGKLECFGSSTS